jgi:hypothetical protein
MWNGEKVFWKTERYVPLGFHCVNEAEARGTGADQYAASYSGSVRPLPK